MDGLDDDDAFGEEDRGLEFIQIGWCSGGGDGNACAAGCWYCMSIISVPWGKEEEGGGGHGGYGHHGMGVSDPTNFDHPHIQLAVCVYVRDREGWRLITGVRPPR